jgi:hypothetical protein
MASKPLKTLGFLASPTGERLPLLLRPTPVIPGASKPGRLLTVREVAERLGVCWAPPAGSVQNPHRGGFLVPAAGASAEQSCGASGQSKTGRTSWETYARRVNTRQVIEAGSRYISALSGHSLDVLTISPPKSLASAVSLGKVISKLSPILGNMIEFSTVDYLNQQAAFEGLGKWKRQDPGFPDAIFEGKVKPTPGFEIKAWFPLATEITARFRDSQAHFLDDRTYVALLAWLPEHLIWGKPAIVNSCVVSGASVAKARDDHYHNPPDYLVIEPEDTSARTLNLQQTNTMGYKFQGKPAELAKAKQIVAKWGAGGKVYSHEAWHQRLVVDLMSKFRYRLDTNFAKIDRIAHPDIEKFKTQVHNTKVHGSTVKEWCRILASDDNKIIEVALRESLKLDFR